MSSLLHDTVEIIKSEGFTGPHSLVFLTRYASLAEDGNLLRLIGNTLEDMSTMEESAALAYAYAEYYEASGDSGSEFCFAAADYILSHCSEDDRMLAAAYVKCARAFGREDYLEKASELLADNERTAGNAAFSVIAFLEMFRATMNRKYLDTAKSMADIIEKNFHGIFLPEDSYDLDRPSMNSAIAVMYDELARITQEPKRIKARERQNSFIAKLAEKFPTKVTFGLCALLADEFEPKTVVCRFKGPELPETLLSLISFYSPVTEVIAESAEEDDISVESGAKYYFLKNGILEEIAGL
ncbi:MAG: hypothetical protein Q4F31_03730 [Eubacteriales bacterium]|nr:hypothetical protein [Eubacteriales bacterium]